MWCGLVVVAGRGATRFFFASCRLSSSLSRAISCEVRAAQGWAGRGTAALRRAGASRGDGRAPRRHGPGSP